MLYSIHFYCALYCPLYLSPMHSPTRHSYSSRDCGNGTMVALASCKKNVLANESSALRCHALLDAVASCFVLRLFACCRGKNDHPSQSVHHQGHPRVSLFAMDDLRQRAIAMAQSHCGPSSLSAMRSGTPPPTRQRALMPATGPEQLHLHRQQMDSTHVSGGSHAAASNDMRMDHLNSSNATPNWRGGQPPGRRPPPVPAEPAGLLKLTPPPPPREQPQQAAASDRDERHISFLYGQIEAMRRSRSSSTAVEQQQQRRPQQSYTDPMQQPLGTSSSAGVGPQQSPSTSMKMATSPGSTRRRALVNPSHAHAQQHTWHAVPQSRVPQTGRFETTPLLQQGDARMAVHRAAGWGDASVPLFTIPGPPHATPPPPPPYDACPDESPQLLSPNSEERPNHLRGPSNTPPLEAARGALAYDEPSVLFNTSKFVEAADLTAVRQQDHTESGYQQLQPMAEASAASATMPLAGALAAASTPSDRVLVAVTQRVNDVESKVSALQGALIRAHANASLELDKARRSAGNAEYRLVELAASVDTSIASLQERVASRLATQRQLREHLSTRWSTSIRRALQEVPLELRQASIDRTGRSLEDTELSVDALLTSLHQFDTQNDMRLISLMRTFMDVQRAARQRIAAAEVVVNARNTVTTSGAMAASRVQNAMGQLAGDGDPQRPASISAVNAPTESPRRQATDDAGGALWTTTPNPNASNSKRLGAPKVIASMHEMLQQFVVQTRSQLAELRRDRRAFEEHFIARVASLAVGGGSGEQQQRSRGH